MKKLNKALALGMAGAMALSMAACGGSGTTSGTASTASTAGTTSGAADGEVVNLTWVNVGTASPPTTTPGWSRSTPTWKKRSASIWTFRSFPGATGTTAAT